MDQPVQRAKVTAEVWYTKSRYAIHSVVSLLGFLLITSAALAMFGPWVVLQVPQSSGLVESLSSLSGYVPVSAFAQLIIGIILVGVLVRT